MQNPGQRSFMKNILIVSVLFVVVIILVLSGYGESRTIRYDCGMAEWHPDIPKEVKEECRRIRYEEWKRQQEENKNREKNIII